MGRQGATFFDTKFGLVGSPINFLFFGGKSINMDVNFQDCMLRCTNVAVSNFTSSNKVDKQNLQRYDSIS